MTHDEMIAVIQAHKDGKVIQARCKGDDWVHCPTPLWDFYHCDYRVKTEPREVWINQYPSNVIGDFAYRTCEDAKRNCPAGLKPIHFREAL